MDPRTPPCCRSPAEVFGGVPATEAAKPTASYARAWAALSEPKTVSRSAQCEEFDSYFPTTQDKGGEPIFNQRTVNADPMLASPSNNRGKKLRTPSTSPSRLLNEIH